MTPFATRAAPHSDAIGSFCDQQSVERRDRRRRLRRPAADSPMPAAAPCRDRACRRDARARTCACTTSSMSVGPMPCSRAVGRPGECRGDGVRVGAVDGDARDAVAGAPCPRRRATADCVAYRRRQRDLVVLDAEDRRQPLRGAEVDRLVPFAERGAAFADERHAPRGREPSRANAIAMPAIDSVLIDSGAAAGRMPHSKSPMCRSLPLIGGPSLPICALSTIRTVAGSGRIASATPRSRMIGPTTSPCHPRRRSRHAAPRRSRMAAA